MTARAAIDIGTTATRLLVVDGDRVVLRRAIVTHLGHEPDATIAALDELRRDLDSAGATEVRAVATEAVRAAPDPAGLLARCSAAIGVGVEVIGPLDEGRLAFAGATAGLGDHQGIVAVLDIGGGSMEVAVGVPGGEPVVMSFPTGARRLLVDELHHDPPRPEELTNAISIVDAHLDDLLRELPEVVGVPVVAVGGTAQVVAAVEIGLLHHSDDALDGFVLTREAAEDVFRTLATEPAADRVHNPGMPAGRAEVIVGGCCALVAVMRRLRLPDVRVSVRDLLDGVVAAMG